ncbi:MAG: class B sortase [Lachnospiraceae bacterium]|nr:class B sortase [Lachnospiraceae bacterium]
MTEDEINEMLAGMKTTETAETETAVEEQKEVIPVKFEELQEVNPDVYAWITVPGTDIDYPILQHASDNSYYLMHNIDGSYGYPGCIYTENMNSKDFTDNNTVIYGHNMKNGSMFAQLHKFEDPDFFDANREVLIYLPGEVLHYTIFAAHIYDDRHLLYSFEFTDPEVYQKYLDSIFSTRDMSANIDKDITVTTDDQIITLVTCIGSQPNNRLLVQAVLTDREPGTETARAAAATE